MDSVQLKYLLNNLEQLILIRPIINSMICLPDILLENFIIYSFNDKIIFKKTFSPHLFSNLMLCNYEIIRKLLIDNYGIFIYYRNPLIPTIIQYIRHLKFYIDNYHQQWSSMSSYLVNTISELTIIIYDNNFEYYNGILFSSLLTNLIKTCQLHFYLEFIPDMILTRRDIDLLFQSFQTDFYLEHQSNVIINYSRTYNALNNCPIIIYTSPFCTSKLTLITNQEMLGNCLDYTNLTQLILDPCFSSYTNIFSPNNQINLLTNLISLEFFHNPLYHLNHMMITINHFFRQISTRLRHMHFHSIQCSSYLIKNIIPLYTFPALRYLDITDNDGNCGILCDILRQKYFCAGIFHLNITGLCRLKVHHIKDIGMELFRKDILFFN